MGLQCERCEVKNGDKEPRGAMISARRRMYARAAVIGRWLLEPIACSCSRTTVAGGKKLSSPSCSSLLRCWVDVCFVSASMQRLDPGVVYSGALLESKNYQRNYWVRTGGYRGRLCDPWTNMLMAVPADGCLWTLMLPSAWAGPILDLTRPLFRRWMPNLA